MNEEASESLGLFYPGLTTKSIIEIYECLAPSTMVEEEGLTT